MEKFPTNNSDNMSDHIDNVSEVVDEVVDDSQESSENDEVGLDDVKTTDSAVESDATQNPDDTGTINVEQIDDTHNDTKDDILPEYRAALEQQEQNSKRVKIALIGTVTIAAIAAALSLGSNKTTTPPQEPEVEDAVDDTEPSEEVVDIIDTPAEDNEPEVVLPVEEEQHYEGSLTTEYVAEKFNCLSFTDAVKSDPEEVAEYISDWMYDNDYISIGDNFDYDNLTLLISAPYATGDINGLIEIESIQSQNKLKIQISNLSDPSNPQYHEYQSNEIPNYDTLLQIAQENLG